jgi:hypothetical protein
MHLPGMARTIRWFRTGRLFATARHGRPVLPNVGTRLQPKGRAEALRASLVSATSLLALLLLDGSEAGADPIIGVGTAVPFFTVLGNQFDAGTEAAGRSSAIQSYMFTPLTSGAAATADGYTGFTPYFQVVQPSASNRVAIDATDSDLPALRRSGSQGRAEAASNSVFIGTGESQALLDSPAGMAAGASSSFSYTIPATPGRADDASMPTDLGYRGDQTRRDGPPVPAGTDPAPVRSLPSPPVVVTPFGGQSSALPGVASGRGSAAFVPAGSVAVPKTGAGGGQFLPGLVPGASVFDAAAADQAAGSTAATTPRSAIREEVEKAFYLGVRPDPDDGNHVDVNRDNAAVMGLRMASPDPSTFTVSSAPGGSAVPVPMPVVGTGAGELSSSLTIFTAAAARLSDGDDSFAFFFDPGILQ